MNIFAKLRRAVADDRGAVTVDWVVLTAAVVILSIGALTTLSGGISGLISSIDAQLSTGGASSVGAKEWGGSIGGGVVEKSN